MLDVPYEQREAATGTCVVGVLNTCCPCHANVNIAAVT